MKESMIRREAASLLNNNILLAAVYVDPLNRVCLNEIQFKKKAKSFLYNIALRISGLVENIETGRELEEDEIRKNMNSQGKFGQSPEISEEYKNFLDNEEQSRKR
ncbi:unnamed protein product [Lepeophtheirus salmonis]|uniref:(salmon louse) hypothetical protein n=1 Tax=Lepeophtheirus salmonis TaxID=72036 RepID=A0A7R8HB17_LEPSM|nr:unnamed protein product [Lepeophtheirus salmonis]CAF2984617.1 unnamed protein product [Lepeophtheirus salmonis]